MCMYMYILDVLYMYSFIYMYMYMYTCTCIHVHVIIHCILYCTLYLLITGDYFIAELIESQDESHQTVVAEVRNTCTCISCKSNDKILYLIITWYM